MCIEGAPTAGDTIYSVSAPKIAALCINYAHCWSKVLGGMHMLIWGKACYKVLAIAYLCSSVIWLPLPKPTLNVCWLIPPSPMSVLFCSAILTVVRQQGYSATMFYTVLIYVANATLGGFRSGDVAYPERDYRSRECLKTTLKGLNQRSPWFALMMMVVHVQPWLVCRLLVGFYRQICRH